MGHVYADIEVIGRRGSRKLERVMVDTGATYTVLPRSVLEAVDAYKLPTKVELELGDGRKVEGDVYAVVIALEDRRGPSMVVSFEGAKPVIGALTLESLGLRVDPTTGRLEETRPAGVAYFY